jgi:hypothetical protein
MNPNEPYSYEPVDPLDELIRRSLQHSTPSVQPPARVWEQIQGQVTAGPAPTSHCPPTERLSRLLAPLVQGLAAAVIFILVGLSLGAARLNDTRLVESTSPLSAPPVVEPRAVPPQTASVQRLGRLAAEDESFDYRLSQSRPQKHAAQAARATHTGLASADPDADLVLSSRSVTYLIGP